MTATRVIWPAESAQSSHFTSMLPSKEQLPVRHVAQKADSVDTTDRPRIIAIGSSPCPELFMLALSPF